MRDRDVVVVKIGSSSVVDAQGRLDEPILRAIASQFARLAGDGLRPVLVSSGAVASGLGILGLKNRPDGLPEHQLHALECEGGLLRALSGQVRNHDLLRARRDGELHGGVAVFAEEGTCVDNRRAVVFPSAVWDAALAVVDGTTDGVTWNVALSPHH